MAAAAHPYDFPVKTIKGVETTFGDIGAAGKVALVVNVASGCGLTPQYEGLEALQKKFGPRGFTVVGFPCNQFGAQESGTEHEIQEFCKTKYSVSFPLTAKVDVNGDNTHPLWAWLKKEHGGILQSVKWNFAKFLIGKDGKVIERYLPTTTPEAIEKDIEKALA